MGAVIKFQSDSYSSWIRTKALGRDLHAAAKAARSFAFAPHNSFAVLEDGIELPQSDGQSRPPSH